MSTSQRTRGRTDVEVQLSEPESGSDEDWINVRISKTKGSQGTCDNFEVDVQSDETIGKSSKGWTVEEKGKSEQKRLLEDAFALLKPAYDQLAIEQHDLLRTCAEKMRRGDQQKDCLALVEETIDDFVCSAVSCIGKTLDAKATDRLKEIQCHFVNDKTQLLNQVAKSEQCADKLHDLNYRVARQLSWFMALLQRLLFGSASDLNVDNLSSDPVEDTDIPAMTARSNCNEDSKARSPNESDELEKDHDPTCAAATNASFGSLDPISKIHKSDAACKEISEHQLESFDVSEAPDSIWAATVWKIIDSQAQTEVGKKKHNAEDEKTRNCNALDTVDVRQAPH